MKEIFFDLPLHMNLVHKECIKLYPHTSDRLLAVSSQFKEIMVIYPRSQQNKLALEGWPELETRIISIRNDNEKQRR